MSPFPPLADENTPLMESDWTSDSPQGAFGVHPQDASSVPYPDLPWPLLYTLQELGLLHDGANAAQPLESLVPLGDVSQFPPPEAAQSADLATDDRAVGAPRGGNGKALHLRLCELCNRTFRRPQEFKRHMDQVHQPQRKCPFNPCAYKWQRPYKIKAHITNEHRSEFCAVDFKKVSSLRGKRIVEFVDACEFWYNSKTTAEPYLLPSLPPLAPSERFMLSEYCGCFPESEDVVSSNGVGGQTVEEATVLPEGMSWPITNGGCNGVPEPRVNMLTAILSALDR